MSWQSLTKLMIFEQINVVNKALINQKIEKTEENATTSFKSSGQSLINFNDLEAISRYLTALIRCYSFKKLKKSCGNFLKFFLNFRTICYPISINRKHRREI